LTGADKGPNKGVSDLTLERDEPAYHAAFMHLRRALLLFAVVLAVAALVTLLAPRRTTTTTPTPIVPPQPLGATASLRTVRLQYPLRAKATTVRVAPGQHLELEVDTGSPGQASAFGMLQNAEAVTPAQFDVLAPPSGRYPVTFQPTDGAPARLATFVVANGRAASGSGRRP
jgi:hypothetical protein